MATPEIRGSNETLTPERLAKGQVYLALNSKNGIELAKWHSALTSAIRPDGGQPTSYLDILKQALQKAKDAGSQYAEARLNELDSAQKLFKLETNYNLAKQIDEPTVQDTVQSLAEQLSELKEEASRNHVINQYSTELLAEEKGIKALAGQITTGIKDKDKIGKEIGILKRLDSELTNILMDANRIVEMSETTTHCDNPHDLYTCKLDLKTAVAKLDERAAKTLAKVRSELDLPNPKQPSETDERNKRIDNATQTSIDNFEGISSYRETSADFVHSKKEKARRAGKIVDKERAQEIQKNSLKTIDPFMKAARKIWPVVSIEEQIDGSAKGFALLGNKLDKTYDELEETNPINIEEVIERANTIELLTKTRHIQSKKIEKACESIFPPQRELVELGIRFAEGLVAAAVINLCSETWILSPLRQEINELTSKVMPESDPKTIASTLKMGGEAIKSISPSLTAGQTLATAKRIVDDTQIILNAEQAKQVAKNAWELAIATKNEDLESLQRLWTGIELTTFAAWNVVPHFLRRDKK